MDRGLKPPKVKIEKESTATIILIVHMRNYQFKLNSTLVSELTTIRYFYLISSAVISQNAEIFLNGYFQRKSSFMHTTRDRSCTILEITKTNRMIKTFPGR